MCEYIRSLLRIRFRCLLLCGFSFAISSYSYGIFAGALLTDNELADVSAGAPGPVPDPTGDRPGVTDDLSIVGEPALGLSGTLLSVDDDVGDNITAAIHENLIVEAGSDAIIERTIQVRLSHFSQAGLEVINLSNTSLSNVANGLNINTDSASLLTYQNNQIVQNEFQQASYEINSDLVLINHEFLRNEINLSFITLETDEIHNDLANRNISRSSVVDVTVDKYLPTLEFIIGDIEKSQVNQINIIPERELRFFSFEPLELPRLWDLSAEYSGLNVRPNFEVNGLEQRGNDLFLDVKLGLPEIDMGTVSAKGCLIICTETDPVYTSFSVDLGSIDKLNIIDGLTLEGMNPLTDLDMSINYGIAYAGQGRFSASDAGIGIKGELTTNLSGNLDFNINLPDNWWIDEFFGADTLSVHREFDYDVVIPFTVLDFKGSGVSDNDDFKVDGFSVEFNGSICLKLFGDDTSCGFLESEYEETFYTDNSTSIEQTKDYFSSTSISESNNYTEVHGGVLTGAEAELIIMTDSDLQLNSDSDVNIKDGAQQKLKAVNVVNSAAAISANSLNMDVARRVQLNPSVSSGVLLNQRNYFNQRL